MHVCQCVCSRILGLSAGMTARAPASQTHPAPSANGAEIKRLFGRCFVLKLIFFQDRLGADIGKAERKWRFSCRDYRMILLRTLNETAAAYETTNASLSAFCAKSTTVLAAALREDTADGKAWHTQVSSHPAFRSFPLTVGRQADDLSRQARDKRVNEKLNAERVAHPSCCWRPRVTRSTPVCRRWRRRRRCSRRSCPTRSRSASSRRSIPTGHCRHWCAIAKHLNNT